MIHEADPKSRDGSDHYFHTCCPSTFKISQNKTKFKREIVIATGGTVGLAWWIIDGTHILWYAV